MQVNGGGIAFEVAFFLGALHALEPGHGKTALFAYMLDGGKKSIHAVTMGIMSGLSHTTSIILFAFMAHLVSHVITNGHDESTWTTHALTAVSGLSMAVIGTFMLVKTLRHRKLGFTPVAACSVCGPDVQRNKLGLLKPMAHTHAMPLKKPTASLKVSAILGASGGLIPCPSAVATYLSGISKGDTASAFIAILFYALGIMACITAIGVIFSFAGEKAGKLVKGGRYGRYVMYAQSALIMAIGTFYTIHSGYQLF